jgi:hypothetical protein
MAPRKTRTDESRDAESRAILENLQADPFHIPEHEIPDGMEYRWVRQSTLGQDDAGNQVERARAGWKAVPADRHENAGVQSTLFREGMREVTTPRGYIEYRGQVLCERPKRIGDMIRAALQQQNEEQLMSTPGMDALAGVGYVKANKVGRSAEFQE